MKTLSILIAAAAMVLAASGADAAEIEDDSAAIKVFRETPALAKYFKGAHGYAVFPTIGKGGVGIGGAYGRGQVYRGGRATGVSKMFQASIGFQLGGQAYSQIIFFRDERAYGEFTSGSFEFDATAMDEFANSPLGAVPDPGSRPVPALSIRHPAAAGEHPGFRLSPQWRIVFGTLF